MRLSKLLVFFLIGIATTGPALAGVPEDPAANAPVVLRGSSAPPAPSPPREIVVREVVYQPAYYLAPYDLPAYYWGLPFGALPLAIVRQHRHGAMTPAAAPAAAQFHPR